MAPHAAGMREINAYISLTGKLLGKYLLERMTEGWGDNIMLDLKSEIGCQEEKQMELVWDCVKWQALISPALNLHKLALHHSHKRVTMGFITLVFSFSTSTKNNGQLSVSQKGKHIHHEVSTVYTVSTSTVLWWCYESIRFRYIHA